MEHHLFYQSDVLLFPFGNSATQSLNISMKFLLEISHRSLGIIEGSTVSDANVLSVFFFRHRIGICDHQVDRSAPVRLFGESASTNDPGFSDTGTSISARHQAPSLIRCTEFNDFSSPCRHFLCLVMIHLAQTFQLSLKTTISTV